MSARLALFGIAVSCWVLAADASAVVDVSGPAQGIAVLPFAAIDARDSSSVEGLPDVAALLASALAMHTGGRVVAPASVLHDERGIDDPQAQDVRRWAEWNSVESVVVGRLGRSEEHGLDVAVELRSGHSGAPRASYRLAPAEDADLEGAVTRLASQILADLGEDADTVTDALPGVSAPSAGASADAATGSAAPEGSGIALIPGVSRDDPISINSDELEVLPQAGGRRLVFSHNVEVLQGGITLTADRLEAVYPQGASQPDLLVASGNVRVSQGDRRGRCDRATYERALHTIVCRGKAEIVQGCDQVRGEEIEFDLGQERVRVKGAASVVIQPEGDEGSECVRQGDAGGAPVVPGGGG